MGLLWLGVVALVLQPNADLRDGGTRPVVVADTTNTTDPPVLRAGTAPIGDTMNVLNLHHPKLPVRRYAVSLLAAIVIAAVGYASPSRAETATPAGSKVPSLQWTDCGDGFQCAEAKVPVDYDDPQDQMISIALIRLPATDRANRIGSLFFNPGGPGTSGVDIARLAAPAFQATGVGTRFDFVGFDPRGVARSSPIRCFDSEADRDSFLAGTPTFPVGEQQHVDFFAKLAEFGKMCRRHNASIMKHMSTANVARDLDLLRQAVGDAGLTYYGVSYGSYLGNTYANMFPHRVRAIAIDGILDPVAYATGRGGGFTVPHSTRIHSDQGAFETLQQFLMLCEMAGPQCAFSAGDPRGKLDVLLTRARQTSGYAQIVEFIVLSLNNPARWPALADVLQQLYSQSEAAAIPSTSLGFGPATMTPEPYNNLPEAQFTSACSDADNPDEPSAWARAATQADLTYPYVGAYWAYNSAACAAWPARDADRYTGPFTRRTASPVLVIGTRYDPATRYQNAQIVADQLPGARLLTLDGWGHGSHSKSSCIRGYVAGYLIDRVLPPPDTVCLPDARPFETPAS
jgi:pimeloyl-ACP methyl ester carboxylesterase